MKLDLSSIQDTTSAERDGEDKQITIAILGLLGLNGEIGEEDYRSLT